MQGRSAGARALVRAITGGLILSIAMSGASAVAAKKPRTPTAAATLRALVRQANALPASAASKAQLRALKRSARHARRAARRHPCAALADLNRLRRTLGRITPKGNSAGARRLAALGPASLTASRLLLSNKKTKRCGGGLKPSAVASTRTRVLSSDENGMHLQVRLPDVRFVARTAGGRTWTQLMLPNTDAPGAPGTPGIPIASSTFGIPDGATLTVTGKATAKYTLDGVNVFPAQPDPIDADTEPPNFFAGEYAVQPFAFDADAYGQKGPVPAQPASGEILGQSRDLTIGTLQVPAVQYDAASDKLTVLQTVDVKVDFVGGADRFTDQVLSPWETQQRRTAASLLNAKAVLKKRPYEILWRCGEEMMVITNPSTLAVAQQFATARSAAGLRTRIFQTGAAAGQIGTTVTQIQSAIRAELTSTPCIHPSYVTIIGDDELVPTFPGAFDIPSDLPYSMKNDADELPDVAVGRILGEDVTQLTNAVTKIITYETTPPTGNFLNRATIAAQFQDMDGPDQVNDGRENRTFIQFAETVRNGLVARGVAVDRIYQDAPETNPTHFNDGTPLPAELLKPTFAWDGDAADVSAAWNEGRFLVIHRDHGWSDGWGDPYYTTTEVNALTNGALLPVVMSINCASAAYDVDEDSFVQMALVKPDGGSVGVFGDTRGSPTWHNSQIGLGFVDGLLPSVLPAEGPATAQRTGDALINGKLRLAGLSPPAGDGNTRAELYLWHYFGDPSMQMWGGGHPPFVFDPSLIKANYTAFVPGPTPIPDPPPYLVEVTFPAALIGQPISLLRNGEVIGKAVAGEGSATIPAAFGDGSVSPGDLMIAIDADGSPPISAPVEVGERSASGGTLLLGSSLAAPASLTKQHPEDSAFWNELIRGVDAGAPLAGQVTKVRIKGTVAAAPSPSAPQPLNEVHFQTLVPQADGTRKVQLTSEAFRLPIGVSPDTVSEFAPENLCINKGEFVDLNTEGGFDATHYPNGALFRFFGEVANSRLAEFHKHEGTGNGMLLAPAYTAGQELLLQVEIAYGDRASFACGGRPLKPGACANPFTGDGLLIGTAMGDALTGGGGDDNLRGLGGDDCLNGVGGDDVMEGGSGNDRLSGGDGDDRGSGGTGDDKLTGGSGDDRLTAAGGDDSITPGSGRDRVSGGSGRDRIRARDGARDTIACGAGRDTVTGDRADAISRDCELVRRS
jgi:hypothetical protein